jgi:hypothetical protein
MLTINEVKKTLQGDLAKLLRDKLISREYRQPARNDYSMRYRKYGYYKITEYGYHYINTYKICEAIEIQK